MEFRFFLSAVSSELGSARDALAASLRSRDLLLRVQSDFRQQAMADTTLRKLHDYIRDCSAVVCAIGQRSGAMPPAASAAPFAHMLPPGITEASYTQWEFFFARHYKRRLSLYLATDAWQPDKSAPADDKPDLQQALIRYIVDEQGLDRDYFGNVDRLCHLVLKEDGRGNCRPSRSSCPTPASARCSKAATPSCPACAPASRAPMVVRRRSALWAASGQANHRNRQRKHLSTQAPTQCA
jgi:Domain of unknown function (DUF4062)